MYKEMTYATVRGAGHMVSDYILGYKNIVEAPSSCIGTRYPATVRPRYVQGFPFRTTMI